MTREPPESTTVKAPLSAASFADSSAVYLASDAARSSSASNMMSFFLEAVSPAAGEAMAETGTSGEHEGDDDKSLLGRDRRRDDGSLSAEEDDRRGLTEDRVVHAAVAEAAAVVDMLAAAWKWRGGLEVVGGGKRRGRWGSNGHFVAVEIVMDGWVARTSSFWTFPRGHTVLWCSTACCWSARSDLPPKKAG